MKVKTINIISCFFLVITQISFAQLDLYVSNNANTYIYVDGDGFADQSADVNNAALFVTNRISLGGLNARIYLRNGAQLVQTGTIENSGRGQLSIYQTGTANNFSYNYWGSPVGNTAASDTANRPLIPDATVASGLFGNLYDVTGSITSDAATYTTAFDGATAPLVISDRWIYMFNPGEVYADWDYVGDDGSVMPGYGFTMKGTAGSGSSQLYDFRGKPNTGTILVPVLAPVGGNPQFTLMGNPYPSAIDMVDFFHDAGASNGTFFNNLQFWQQQSSGSHNLNSYVGGYAIYTISPVGVVSYVPAPRETYDSAGNVVGNLGNFPQNTPGVDVPGRYLPVGQGFMVEGTASGDIEFRNSFRRYWKESSGNSHFFEPNDESDRSSAINATFNAEDTFSGNAIPDDWMRARIVIDIEDTAGFYSRELLINFNDQATEAFDFGMEAPFSDFKPSDGYLLENGEPRSILALPFDMESKIPLTVLSAQQQNLGIRAYAIQNFPDDVPVLLHDILNDTYTNLRVQNFTTPIDAGTFENRFEIVFQPEDTLSEEDIISADFMVFQNNNAAQLTILNPNNDQLKHLNLYDVSGKSILDQELDTQSAYYFSTKNLSDGVYVVQILANEGTSITKKVIVKN